MGSPGHGFQEPQASCSCFFTGHSPWPSLSSTQEGSVGFSVSTGFPDAHRLKPWGFVGLRRHPHGNVDKATSRGWLPATLVPGLFPPVAAPSLSSFRVRGLPACVLLNALSSGISRNKLMPWAVPSLNAASPAGSKPGDAAQERVSVFPSGAHDPTSLVGLTLPSGCGAWVSVSPWAKMLHLQCFLQPCYPPTQCSGWWREETMAESTTKR